LLLLLLLLLLLSLFGLPRAPSALLWLYTLDYVMH
jgi:hypothetical protein